MSQNIRIACIKPKFALCVSDNKNITDKDIEIISKNIQHYIDKTVFEMLQNELLYGTMATNNDIFCDLFDAHKKKQEPIVFNTRITPFISKESRFRIYQPIDYLKEV